MLKLTKPQKKKLNTAGYVYPHPKVKMTFKTAANRVRSLLGLYPDWKPYGWIQMASTIVTRAHGDEKLDKEAISLEEAKAIVTGFLENHYKQSKAKGVPFHVYKPQDAGHKTIDFYNTQAWRELRYQVLAKYGATCQCCGRSQRKHGVVIHVDHIKPKSVYPALAYDINNLQILCEDCNLGKVNLDMTDWRK